MGLFSILGERIKDSIGPHLAIELPSSSIRIPAHYIVFDIETTGFSRTNDRIIEISAIKYSHGKPIEKFHTFINPERHIPNSITRLTGISNADVQSAPCILEAKADLLRFFERETLVGHNIKTFDIPFLEAQLSYHFSNRLIDTLHIAKQVFPYLPSYKLSVLDQILQLGNLEHHRAENDVIVNNALLLACVNPQKYKKRVNDPDVLANIEIERRDPYPKIDIHAFTPTNPEITPCTQLTGKCVAFSGELSILREDACQIAVDAGAILKSRVSRKVDYLVLGIVDPMFLDEHGMSSQQRTARQLIRSGEAKIKIIDEAEFMRLASPTNKVITK